MLTTCRLISLRPIGIDEILNRVIDEPINWVLQDDTKEAVRSLQTATGLKAGAEEIIHEMWNIFEDPSTEGVILVDTSNAFNSLNRKLALHNIWIAFPHFSHILINTYRASSRKITMGGAGIQSAENTTQDDNLAMSFYAIGTVQIQQLLHTSVSDWKKFLHVDDATVEGLRNSLRNW